jgi:hypothetical protein
MLRQNIEYPRTLDGIAVISMDGSPESVDWFIAKREARIDQAA